MTTEQIKQLIAQKIAGQGTAVDAGGALPGILDGLTDLLSQAEAALADMPRPIVLSDEPTVDMTTQEELDAIGLTFDEIKAAAEGKRTGVIQNGFLPILSAAWDEAGFEIKYGYCTLDGEGALESEYVVTIGKSGDVVSVTIYDA